jgi:hypothetical protein
MTLDAATGRLFVTKDATLSGRETAWNVSANGSIVSANG